MQMEKFDLGISFVNGTHLIWEYRLLTGHKMSRVIF